MVWYRKGKKAMKQKLTRREYIYVASILFGLFFGTGNLIFPLYMGQMADYNVLPAAVGDRLSPRAGSAAERAVRCRGKCFC